MRTKNISIETPVFIKLEGNEVLNFVARDKICAKYGVVGFTNEQVKVYDYRTKGLEAIDVVISTEQVEEFPKNFCFPSLLRLSHHEQKTLIELYNLERTVEPEFMLWITTSLEEPIPDYKYPFFRIESLANSTYSFISLFNYQRFQNYFTNQISLQVHAEI